MSKGISENHELAMNEDMDMTDIGSLKVKEHIPDNLSVQDVLSFVQANVEAWKELQTYYYCAMLEIETKFKVLDQEFSLHHARNPIETIKTRMKSPESLADKLIRKNLPLNIQAVEENIFDMAGVRIICSFLDDIYMLASSFLGQDDVYMLRKKDYIQTPKPSGYRGLHLVVEVPIFLHNEKRMMKVEVQFRTIAMDFWASLEHKLRYKKNLNEELLSEVESELFGCSEAAYFLDKKMQNIRNRIEQI